MISINESIKNTTPATHIKQCIMDQQQKGYQLDLVTPINKPWEASSRRDIRESLQNRYTPRPLPVSIHLFLKRGDEPFLFRLFSLCADWSRTLVGRERS